MSGEYTAFGVCSGCRTRILYSPVRMPVSAPIPNPDKPLHYGIEYVEMCVPCARDAINEMSTEVAVGTLSPNSVWSQSEDGTLHIVSAALPPLVAEEPAKVGLFKRILRFFW